MGPAARDAARPRAGRRGPPQALRRQGADARVVPGPAVHREPARRSSSSRTLLLADPPAADARPRLLRRPDRGGRRRREDRPGAGRSPSSPLAELARFDLNALDRDFLRRLILRPSDEGHAIRLDRRGPAQARRRSGSTSSRRWPSTPTGTPTPGSPPCAATGPTWARDAGVRRGPGRPGARLAPGRPPVRPADLGFDWLLKLAARGEPRYHDFAVETMIKGFIPADFAPSGRAPRPRPPPRRRRWTSGGASFLFTGKMATMKRKEAEDKVRPRGRRGGLGGLGQAPLPGHRRRGVAALRPRQEGGQAAQGRGAERRRGEHQDHLRDRVPEDARRAAPRRRRRDATLAGCERLWADGHRRRARPTPRWRGSPSSTSAGTTPTSPWPRPTGRSTPAPRSRPSSSASSGSSRCSARAASRSATWPWSWPGGSSPAGRRRPTSWSGWPRARTPTSAGSWPRPCWPTTRPSTAATGSTPSRSSPAAVYRLLRVGRRIDPVAGHAADRALAPAAASPRSCSA